MTPLGERLVAQIRATGPMDLASFTTLCLGHPVLGYYGSRDPLGVAGDFVTAPEISQTFGELIGLALAQRWLDLGRPAPFHLVELGPGRGTLLADALRATATVAGFHGSMKLQLVETSPALRARQAQALTEHGPVWHEDLASLPGDGPLLLVANEFLDVLPIRQYVRTEQGWRERLITADQDGELGLTLSARTMPLDLDPAAAALPLNAVIELSPARSAVMAEIAGRIAGQGGMAVLIDYGGSDPAGDTFQAVKGHEKIDPLTFPGEADLTSHVDFRAAGLAAAKAGVGVFGPVTQGEYLGRLGIMTRLFALVRGRDQARMLELESGVRRLIDPDAMGELFKVMALAPHDTPPPPGFLAEERLGA